MKYYTIRFLLNGTVLLNAVTKSSVFNMPIEKVKELIKSYGADEAQLYESTIYGHYQIGRLDTYPIKSIKNK